MGRRMTTTRSTRARRVASAVATVGLIGGLVAGVVPASAQSAADVRVGENILLDHDDPRPTRGRDAVGVAVHPDDTDHLVMVNADLYAFTCEFHVSSDGGASWDSGEFDAPAGFPEDPCSPVGHGATSFAGSVDFGSGDNVYSTFASARQTADGTASNGLSALVARSTDGGRTFATAVEAIPGAAGRTAHHIFPELVAIPRAGQPDRVVVVAHDTGRLTEEDPPHNDATVAVSEDGGLTWTSTRITANAADQDVREVSEPVAAPDGTIYVAWRDHAFEGKLWVGRSSDGVTWERFAVADVHGYRSPDRDWNGYNYPRPAVGPDGEVYITYFEGPLPPASSAQLRTFDHFIHPNAQIKLVRSTDRGATWSAPVIVNDDPPAADGNELHQVRHPSVTVAADGRVDVFWHDRRHWYEGCDHTHAECDEARLGDTYWASSTDGGVTFGEDRRITDRSMNNDIGSDYRLGVYWEYPPRAVHLGDDRMLVAWMDSRQGNWNTDSLEIYYAKIDLAASADIPTRRLSAGDPADLSVVLGRHAYPGGSEATLTSTFATRDWTHVIVVNETDVAAAVAGGVLARYRLGPVLATPAAGLAASVADEVERMTPAGAYVIGSETALSAEVEADLAAAGIAAEDIVRIPSSGPGGAAEIARLMDQRTDEERSADAPAFDAVVVVNPGTPHAATAAALAANRRLPVLFVQQDAVPAPTAQALQEFDIDTTLVIGGRAQVSDAVMAQLPGAIRLGSDDVHATSKAVVVESLARGLPANIVHLSDGADPMRSALTGAAVGRATGLHLLTPGAATASASTTLAELGVVADVDRFVITDGLDGRRALTWACPEGAVPAPGFSDVAGNTHEDAIACAAWYGLTVGGAGGAAPDVFAPDAQVRRDQMASFLARLIDHAKPALLPAASGGNPFPCDLTETNAHYDAIRRLAAAGIVLGGPGSSPDDCYGPALSVDRAQMASFINRVVTFVGERPIVTDGDFFTDTGGTHADNIDALASVGIVVGRSAGTYAPRWSVDRAQMTAFLDRALDHLIEHEEALRPEIGTR